MPEPTRILLPSLALPVGNRPPASPFQFFLAGNEAIRIQTWNTEPGVTVRFVARFVNEHGDLSWISFDHTPKSDATRATTYHALGAGFIVNASAFLSNGNARVGQTFVQVQVVVGDEAAALRMGTLLQGYVTADQELAYPGSPITNSLDGGGYVRYVDEPAPALGFPVVVTVPAGLRWELLAVSTTFVASAAVANRNVFLVIDDGLSVAFKSWTIGNVTAGQFKLGTWAQGMPLAAELLLGNSVVGLLSGAPLLSGHRFQIGALNIQAGDQFGSCTYVVREWIEAQ